MLTLTKTTDDAALYHARADGQVCSTVLCLDIETGELSADWQEPGIMSMRQFHGIEITWSIPALKVQALNRLMQTVSASCQTILAGSEIEWNGSNYVGILDDSATESRYHVESICDDVGNDPDDVYSEWGAADWFAQSDALEDLGLSSASTDAEIATAAEQAIADAKSDGTISAMMSRSTYSNFVTNFVMKTSS